MKNMSIQYAYHIDELRRRSKITVDDFCDGICSDRQYRRYLSGVHRITQANIILFCRKLSLSMSDFYYSFHQQDSKEYMKVYEIFQEINNNNLKKAYRLIDDLESHKFLNIQSERWFSYCKITINVVSNKINSYTAYELYKKLVNYPSCLDKKVFDFVDIIIIMKIANIEYVLKKEEALIFLYKVLYDRKILYVSSDSRYILPSIYADVTRIFGMKDMIEEALTVSSNGIEYSLKIDDSHALAKLYYFKSYALFRLGKVNEGLLEAKKCIATTISRNDKKDEELYSRLIKDDFKVESSDLFIPGFIKVE